MWICLNDAFLSIVAVKGDDERLLVRARRAGDIERVFPDAEVLVGAGTDYRYRAFLKRSTVSDAIAQRLELIDYTNFKNSVRDPNWRNAYLEIWHAIRARQN